MKRETIYLLANGCASCDPKTRNLLKALHESLRGNDLLGSVRIVVLEPGNTLYREIAPKRVLTPVIQYHGGAYYLGQIPVLMQVVKGSVNVS